MILRDYKKIYDYIEEDKYFYVVVLKGKRLEPNPLRDKLCETITNLSDGMYIYADVSLHKSKGIQLQNVRDKKKHNGIILRRSVLEECLVKMGISLIDGLKAELAYAKTMKSVNEQRERLLVRMAKRREQTKHSKKYGTNKYDVCKHSGIIGGKVDTRFSSWIADNKKKLQENPTKSEMQMTQRLYKTYKKRLKVQQPFVIDGKVYYADICIKSKNAIVEVDGGYHKTAEQKAKDAERDKAFQSIGYKTIRIQNEDVNNKAKVKEVLEQINK